MAENHEGSSGAENGGLARTLGVPLLAIYGVGTILGAGIYVLVGKIGGTAGYWTPVAFLVAAVVAGINGLAYAELASRRPGAGGPSEYTEAAFSRTWLSVVIGWMIAATGIVSAATIAEGFAGYVAQFVDVPEWLPSVVMLAGVGGVAVMGIKQSAWFMAITTVLGVAGLLFVIWAGLASDEAESVQHTFSRMPSLTASGVAASVLTGAFLAIYSFIGFEDMVHMAEEVRNPKRAMPIAIVIAIIVAAGFYTLVSLAALGLMTPEELGGSEAPLVDAVENAGYPGWPIAGLSLWIILNGSLAQIVMVSRVVYSLREWGGAPPWLTSINDRTHTPLHATAAATFVAVLFTLFLPLETLAAITSFVMLLVFAASSAALIRLEKREPDPPFDTPVWLPWIALIASIGLVVYRFFVGTGGH